MVALSGTIQGLAMDADTARHHIERIQEHMTRADHHVNQARKLILDLKEQEGWRVLGYKSWRACVMTEFNKKSSTVYRQLNAALVELELSPAGGNIGAIEERVLRPLTNRGFDSEARAAIWACAQEVVGAGGKVTSGVVEAVVDGFKDMLASGATQDGDGHQTALSERMGADLVARVRQVKIAHKEHIRGMDSKRDYLIGGAKVIGIRTNPHIQTARVDVTGLDGLQLDKIAEAKRLGKPIKISLWTEE